MATLTQTGLHILYIDIPDKPVAEALGELRQRIIVWSWEQSIIARGRDVYTQISGQCHSNSLQFERKRNNPKSSVSIPVRYAFSSFHSIIFLENNSYHDIEFSRTCPCLWWQKFIYYRKVDNFPVQPKFADFRSTLRHASGSTLIPLQIS